MVLIVNSTRGKLQIGTVNFAFQNKNSLNVFTTKKDNIRGDGNYNLPDLIFVY